MFLHLGLGNIILKKLKKLLSEKIKEKWQDPIFAEKVRQKMLEVSKEQNRNEKFSPLKRK